MIAGRRDRRRSLIRPNAMTAAMARNISPKAGVAASQTGPSSEFGRATPVSPSTMSTSRSDVMMYLRQLSILHAAGILNDEEFSSAQGRLLGS